MPDTVCIGVTRLYHVNDPTIPSTYTWKIDGATQASTKNDISIVWNTPGVFLLTVQEHPSTGCDGDIRSGSVYVVPPPVANAGTNAIVCFGTNIRLNGSGGIIYQWAPTIYLSDPSIANPILNIPTQGTYNYILNVTDAKGCRSLVPDTVAITVLPPLKVFAGRDTSIVINQPIQLNAIDINNSGFINYSWSPSTGLNNPLIKSPIAILNGEITYTVTARTDAGCEAQDNINIKIFMRSEIFVPTAFTPNGDGLNDILKAIPIGIKEFKRFSIYNRSGELVFTTSDPAVGWNGIFKGKEQPSAVFVWIAEGKDYNGNTIFKKGTATLIR
jgi:gliding motility-associated-like protein